MLNVLWGAWRRLRTVSRATAAASVLLAVTVLPAHAMDDPPGRVGRVALVQGGQAWMQENGEGEWFELVRNRPVTTGDRIATDRDTRLVLQIGSSTLRLDGGSEVGVDRLDDDRVDVSLANGSVGLRIREPESIREFGLSTREGSFAARSTGSFRVDRDEAGLQASSFSGEIQFTGSGNNFVLRGGQSARLANGAGRGSELIWGNLAGDDFERWVRAEDATQRPRVAQGPVSWEMTGADDLDRSGRWETSPDYGPVWTPSAVAVDWAPYRYGRWVSVQPWGWTWVDDAPWGFAPFHYGRWVYWGQRWCWAPGEYVRRPVYAPAMVAWVGGKNWGVSMSLGGAPTVGWVPLGPREVYVPSYRHTTVYVQKVNITHVHLPRDYRESDKPDRPIRYINQDRPGGLGVIEAKNFERHEPRGLSVRPTPGLFNPGNKQIDLERAAPPQAPTRQAVNDQPPGRRFPGADSRPSGDDNEGSRSRPIPSRAVREAEAPGAGTPPDVGRNRGADNPRDGRDGSELDRRPNGRPVPTSQPSVDRVQSGPMIPPAARQPFPQPAPAPAAEVERPNRFERPERVDRPDRVERQDRPDKQARPERQGQVDAVPQAPKPEPPKRVERVERVEADKPQAPKPPQRAEPERKPGRPDPKRDGSLN